MNRNLRVSPRTHSLEYGGDQGRELWLADAFTAGPVQQAMGEPITRSLVVGNRTCDQRVVELNRHLMAGTQRIIVASQCRPGAENGQVFTIEQAQVPYRCESRYGGH